LEVPDDHDDVEDERRAALLRPRTQAMDIHDDDEEEEEDHDDAEEVEDVEEIFVRDVFSAHSSCNSNGRVAHRFQ